MMRDEGWQIVSVKTEAAKRLLARAGLLTPDITILTQRRRSRTHFERRLWRIAGLLLPLPAILFQ
jgi:hypothetical protein